MLKISVILSLLGVFVLFLIPESFTKAEACNLKDGEKVFFTATLSKISAREDVSFFTFNNGNCSVKGVAFDKVSAKKGEEYFVYGKVSTYMQEKEIIVDKMVLFDSS